MSVSPADLFAANVTIQGAEGDHRLHHWTWTGRRLVSGVPTLDWYENKTMWAQTAHRWAYEQEIGPIGRKPLKRVCDVPLCVNPHHWVPRRQTPNHRLALTEPQVAYLVEVYEAGEAPARLAERFDMSRTSVRRVLVQAGAAVRDRSDVPGAPHRPRGAASASVVEPFIHPKVEPTPGPAVRVLAGKVPDWMAPHLTGWDVLTGPAASAAAAADTVVRYAGPPVRLQRGGRRVGLWSHGTERCYYRGCRLPECREARTLADQRRALVKQTELVGAL